MTTLAAIAPVTYGYIYSHMRKRKRVTTLAILNPGDDFLDGIPCDSVADAAERADGMGVMLLDISEVCEILKQRREVPANVAAYLEQDAFTSHEREERQIVAVTPLLELYPVTADVLPVELSEPLEVIGEGDLLLIRRDLGRKSFYARVEAIDEAAQQVRVWDAQGGYYAGTWHVDSVELIAKAAALEVGTTSAV
jgi:hypothetical protein